jgi:hypothetical protein
VAEIRPLAEDLEGQLKPNRIPYFVQYVRLVAAGRMLAYGLTLHGLHAPGWPMPAISSTSHTG